MKILEWKLTKIKPYENNPRKNDAAVDKVAASIEAFGFKVPIIVDRNGVIVAGHTRLKAAEKLGLKTAPVIVAEDLDEEQARQYRIVDNKTGELSSWNYERLLKEIDAVDDMDIDFLEFGAGEKEDDQKEVTEKTSNLDEGEEIDLTDFDDETFENECPYCGFMWND